MNQQPLQSALPLIDEYLVGIQTRQTLVIDDNSSLLTPLMIDKPKWKETFQMRKQPESTADKIPEGETDNIPFNQLYYIVKNCADHYYTK